MTTLAHRSALRRPANGGVAARRAVVRWAWRLFRREWRQQILVVTLLTVAVAAAIASVTIAYNSGPANDAEFGSASQILELDGADPRKLEAALAAAEERFGTIDVIARRSLPVPGSVETVEFRAQDPRGAYGSAMLALRRGSYPAGPSQVAVTDGVATLLGLEIGQTLALDGHRRTVVGIVENPRDLSDEFALVSPSAAGTPDTVSVLVDASFASVEAFFQAQGDRSALVGSRARGNDLPADELLMFSVATVFLLLASLIAAAGFADSDFHDVDVPVYYGPDVDAALAFVGRFANVSEALSRSGPRGAGSILARLRATLESRASERGVWLGSRAWIVTALRQ